MGSVPRALWSRRNPCDCHQRRRCVALPHDCDRPCTWPACLPEAEQDRLAEGLRTIWPRQ